jgi:hypothetical protein
VPAESVDQYPVPAGLVQAAPAAVAVPAAEGVPCGRRGGVLGPGGQLWGFVTVDEYRLPRGELVAFGPRRSAPGRTPSTTTSHPTDPPSLCCCGVQGGILGRVVRLELRAAQDVPALITVDAHAGMHLHHSVVSVLGWRSQGAVFYPSHCSLQALVWIAQKRTGW